MRKNGSPSQGEVMEKEEFAEEFKRMVVDVVLSQGALRQALLEADIALANLAILRQDAELKRKVS
jgi:hypothetical protein